MWSEFEECRSVGVLEFFAFENNGGVVAWVGLCGIIGIFDVLIYVTDLVLDAAFDSMRIFSFGF